MNLDELRAALRTEWTAAQALPPLDPARLAQTVRQQAAKAGRFQRWAGNLYEWLAGGLTLALLTLFVLRHGHDGRLAAMALLLMAWCAALLAMNLMQLRASHRLDWTQPVLVLQQRVETLRVQRLRGLQWALLTGQFVWSVPFVVVAFMALTGVNLFDAAPHFVAVGLGLGVLFIPLAMGLARWVPASGWQSQRWQRLADSLAGRDVATARQTLAQLHRFEQAQ